MSELIPPEAVEAAAKATFDYTWDEVVQEEPVLVELWRDQLRTALETGAQHIRIKGIAEGFTMAANYCEEERGQE